MCDLFPKKNQRNYRSKVENSDDEVNDDVESLYEQGFKASICPKSAPDSAGAIKKSRSVLSFEDDLGPDDGDVFTVKKSVNHRAPKQAKEQKKKKTYASDIIKVVERREQVEKQSNQPSVDPLDSQKQLENLRKQLLDLNDDESPTDEISSTKSTGVNSILRGGPIPDAATIHLARKQRERAKSLMGASDCGERSDVSVKGGDSRLIREDDDDDDDDFDETEAVSQPLASHHSIGASSERRHAFVLPGNRQVPSKRTGISDCFRHREAELNSFRDDFLATEHGSGRDSDQDAKWEMQQIQKALISQNTAVLEAIQPIGGRADQHSGGRTAPHSLSVSSNGDSISLSSLKVDLQDRFNTLASKLAENESALKQAKSDLDQSHNMIFESREKLPSAARQFAFSQEMKAFVDDLVECFNEKMSKIEYLERKAVMLSKERYTKLADRRRQDMKDLADMATQPTVNVGSRTPEEAKLFEAMKRRTAERDSRRIRRQRARENANQLVTNTVPASTRQSVAAGEYVPGESSDDEEPQAVIAKRQADLDSILVDAGLLLADVVDEFCQLPLILKHFGDWRINYPESYAQAYVPVCLPQLLSPLIRIQLVGWNPIQSTCTPMEEMQWFVDLLDFVCLPAPNEPVKPSFKVEDSAEVEASREVDENLRLLAYAVEKVVIDRLTDLVSAAWDPLSAKESVRLVDLTRHLSSHYPTIRIGSKATENLFVAVVKRIEQTIQEDIFIPLYSKQLMQARQGPAFLFFDRQLRIGMKLLKNILLWAGLLSDEALQHVALTSLVNRYLLVGLASLLASTDLDSPGSDRSGIAQLSGLVTNQTNPQQDALHDVFGYLHRIADCLPKKWLSNNRMSASDGSLNSGQAGAESRVTKTNPLQQLYRFVVQLLERCQSKERSLVKGVNRDSVLAVMQLKSLLS